MKARLELFLISARRLLLFLFSVCLLLSGCPSFSSHPLYTDEDVVMEPLWRERGPVSPPGTKNFFFRKPEAPNTVWSSFVLKQESVKITTSTWCAWEVSCSRKGNMHGYTWSDDSTVGTVDSVRTSDFWTSLVRE